MYEKICNVASEKMLTLLLYCSLNSSRDTESDENQWLDFSLKSYGIAEKNAESIFFPSIAKQKT